MVGRMRPESQRLVIRRFPPKMCECTAISDSVVSTYNSGRHDCLLTANSVLISLVMVESLD